MSTNSLNMNRIILIGNGFDLAHGMKTGYSDFLDDVWNLFEKEIEKYSKLPDINFENDFITVTGPNHLPINTTFNNEDKIGFERFKYRILRYGYRYTIKNSFLELITQKKNIQNWVDIENEYYQKLKYYTNSQNTEGYGIEELNNDFSGITNLLEKYLSEIQNSFLKGDKNKQAQGIHLKIYSPFYYRDFSESAVEKKVADLYGSIKNYLPDMKKGNVKLHFGDEKKQKLIDLIGVNKNENEIKKTLTKALTSNEKNSHLHEFHPETVLFLNFNYTRTEKLYNTTNHVNQYDYLDGIKTSTIRIHGSLDKEDKNPIIFGYGDELDDDYSIIEKLNNDRFLDNIKSIKYSETDNYKRLLEFLNTDDFQVFLFGHSCGVSDRTLLNTIFEHENCVSIKPFYHQKGDGSDNYINLVQKISRNFTSKVQMRSKVVNKTYCEPLT